QCAARASTSISSPFLTKSHPALQADQKRRIRERTAEEIEVDARAAHCGGLAPVAGRDPALGQVLRTETADDLAASKPASTDRARNSGKQRCKRAIVSGAERARFKGAGDERVWRCAGSYAAQSRY